MVEFKLAIGDPKEKKTWKLEVKEDDAEKFIGLKIGDKFNGELINITGYELEITGGSNKAGFPMRSDIEGQGRRKILATKGLGFNAKRKGQRKRKSIMGNTISQETSQINCKVIKYGSEPLSKSLAPAPEAPTEGAENEAPKEAPKEPVKEEKPAEESKKEEKPAEEKKE